MNPTDTLRFSLRAARGYPLRTALLVLAMSIGVVAVVTLTAIGEGIRRYVINQFSSLGSNLIIVLPGRTETGGLKLRNTVTNTARDLTVSDAAALARSPFAEFAAPLSVGDSEVSANGRLRTTIILGTTAEFTRVRHLNLSQGQFLPEEDWQRTGNVAVLGATIHTELFGTDSPLGKMVRLGDRRLRVIGVMSPSGQGLDMNTDELVIVPVATAQAIFNTTTLFRVLIETRSRNTIDSAKDEFERLMKGRHEGELDVTLVTQDAMLETFDRILRNLTIAVAAIAGISLAVAGILVMNVMLVSVTQRTAEIGLLKALGASRRDILHIFITEATSLSLLGALAGTVLGLGGAWLIRLNWPTLPAWPPAWAVGAALCMAMGCGLVFGVMPARRAAALDPVFALSQH